MRRRFMSKGNYLQPMYFEAIEDGLTISIDNSVVEYRIDTDGEWQILPKGETTPAVSSGTKIFFKRNNLNLVGNFSTNIGFKLGGDCRSLLYGEKVQKDSPLIDNCFIGLFKNTLVVEIENNFLPATTLSEFCYSRMFSGCTSLVNAPELPATTLARYCYQSMFSGCTNLNYIKMLATDISAESCLSDWVYGVSPTGTFVKSKDATWDVVGDSGVPTGWTVITDDQSVEFGEVTTFYDADMGESFNFVFGMTWREFIDSEYNTGEYSIEQVGIINPVFYVVNGYGSRVGHYQGSLYINAYADDIIVPNINYFE